MSVFYNWLYSIKSGFGFKPTTNPITQVEAPRRPKFILSSLTKEQVELLIDKAGNTRDKAIIALFVESGLRVTELANIKVPDIDWEHRIIEVLGKGNKEGYAPFGSLSERYLKTWLEEHRPRAKNNIWVIQRRGIQ
jgi:site-specific recombinase XerD